MFPTTRNFLSLSLDSGNSVVDGASWSDDDFDTNRNGTGVFHPNIELELTDNDEDENNFPPIDLLLHDDLQERILASLPLAAIFKACCVCRKWNRIIHSELFKFNDETLLAQKPWYFMYTSSDEPLGYLYDTVLKKWYNFELPFLVQHTWVISHSCGLVCFMDEENNNEMFICNPITQRFEVLEKPSGPGFSVYSALAFSVDLSEHEYAVSVVRTMQASEDFLFWDIAIHVYHSKNVKWSPPLMGKMMGWRPGNVSVICNRVLYILVFCTRTGEVQNCHGLITCSLDNLDTRTSIGLITTDMILPVPCSLTCGRLMNVQEKLVMVGGIGRPDRPGVIKGIGIWVLEGKEWEEVSRMPHRYSQGFGEFDDVFASTGGGDLIYVQSYGGTALLIFDMRLKQWHWSQKCPMMKRFPLQIFSGFCFQPRLGFLS